jgi:hypothetical protein
MSSDLRVWGRTLRDMNSRFPAREGWTSSASGWVLAKRSWQITIGTPQVVEPEDVPTGASEILPGLSTLAEISLEPISAPKSAQSILMAAAQAVAEELAGVVEDPQEGTLKLPRGAKRYLKPKREERFAALALSWWYLKSPLRSTSGVAELLAMLGKHVPEAVPRRYGLWEPPQHKTGDTGVDALAAFVSEHLDDCPVLYATRPVVGISVADCNGAVHPHLGFRANCFGLKIEADVLGQQGWEEAVRNVWRAVSRFLKPFYGEARVLSDFLWRGATTGFDRRTAVDPVRSWFWRGIPSHPGLAMVLGPPYTELWRPGNASVDGELFFVEQDKWSDQTPLRLSVPREIAQRWMPAWVEQVRGGYAVNWCDELPETFPF